MTYTNLLVSTLGNATLLTINRPERLNALNFETLQELKHFFEHAEDLYSAAIILTGAGQKAFVAGADITQFTKLTPENGSQVAKDGQDIYFLIEQCKKPVIAAVNGFALGGGCELALACHMRVATESAIFGQPEVNLGIIPGYGGSQRLAKLIGSGRAIELVATARNINATEAYQLGLLNYVVSADMLLAKCTEIVDLIAQKPPIQVYYAMQSVLAYDTPNGYKLEAKLFGECMKTEDFKEGVDAFLNKRKAEFKGK
jgi:enoyl-CoA hydratase